MRIASVVLLVGLLPCLVMGELWNEHTVVGDFNGATCVCAADVDGDGDMDVIGVAYVGADITWWENADGTGSNWIEHVVDYGFVGARSVYTTDLDGDGDLDILGAASVDDFSWWENLDGTGLNWSEHVVYNPVPNALGVSVYAEDLDNDGDMDILGAESGTDHITWWENVDGTGLTLSAHTVDGEFDGANSVYAEDVDGDGDMDVLGAAFSEDQIAWWENTDGTGMNWSEHIVRTSFDGAVNVYAEDLDGDGDMDVLSGAYNDSEISWWENTNGTGLTWSEHDVAPMYHVNHVCSEDIDGDGDMDLLAVAGEGADFLSWWENLDGTGLNWTEHLVDSDFTNGFYTCSADVDADGLMDILGAARDDDDISWWEQYFPVEVSLSAISYPVLIPSVGGPFWYSIELTNQMNTIVQGVFITEAILPSGYTYGPMLSFNLALAGGQVLPSPLLQVDVPAFAPVGVYEFHAIFSPFVPSGYEHSDFFEFEKLSAPSAAPVVSEWGYTPWAEMETVVSSNPELPDEFTVSQACPNPFNPSTVISVSLPETADLTVIAYNVAGQQVAELAAGQYAAGTHLLTFDASSLAGGLYFIRATVPGKLDQVQKVMLVK